MVYWHWAKRITSTKIKRTLKFTCAKKNKKLQPKDELLQVLKRLHLGLLTDLADWGISPNPLLKLFQNLNTTSKQHHWRVADLVSKKICNINYVRNFNRCQVKLRWLLWGFYRKAKKLVAPAATWPDYKSHDTMKFLIGISTTGFLTFLSNKYGGRASYKFICDNSRLFDSLDSYAVMMKLW